MEPPLMRIKNAAFQHTCIAQPVYAGWMRFKGKGWLKQVSIFFPDVYRKSFLHRLPFVIVHVLYGYCFMVQVAKVENILT